MTPLRGQRNRLAGEKISKAQLSDMMPALLVRRYLG